jgi:D-beta-D-heptose 7-phosphate kinase / D-beta-D-heptose 1-phosphate adenosyltransferase
MSYPRDLEAVSRVMTATDLARTLAPLRQAGQKVVFTNGCFDLIHAGHITLLEHSARLGDLLVLGLNSDRSVRQLKGEGRPVVSEDVRALVLASLRVVDYVVLFDEETPQQLIEILVPDVLVKGGDYELDAIVGRDVVESAGGKVIRVPIVDGFSSTNLIQRLKDTP